MDFKKLTLAVLTIALLFIFLGDRVFPEPVAGYSLNTRTTLNKMLIGLLPSIKPQNPDAKTEETVDKLYESR
ncbi:hypothetical protein C1752_07479 [Acaryochloris thomasi RCC1774]|uniref:Uncharacterized protein n=1 Tax=Acaryochloris thomasi RCC1774 TaxID=1764569 RepID=A0A2W1JAQ9_9CYAN|nr:hypothetical protein [Acaryochloris thomasi]PZD71203.1 hypothetical protein C1752_07479 [Acaryochloris thomasi RCC1774]